MKRWYVAQVYKGYEEIVKKDIDRRVAKLKTDLIGQVLIPSAKMKSMFAPQEEEQDEQLFPGYVLIEMEKTPEALAIIALTPKIVKFLGGKEPMPISKREISRILSQVKGEVVVSTGPKEIFNEGAEIDIKEGPFAGFVGIVEKVDEEGEKLTVMVSIFGRLTPVELTFDQVKK